MKKLLIPLSLIMSLNSFGFNCKQQLERDIQHRQTKANQSLTKIPKRMIKSCLAKDTKARLSSCLLSAYLPAVIIGIPLAGGIPIIGPIFVGAALALDWSSKDRHGIKLIDHKRQLSLSKKLYSALKGEKKALTQIRRMIPRYRHVTDEDLLSAINTLDYNSSLCQEKGHLAKKLSITSQGMLELERKSKELGIKLTWFDLLTLDGYESELSQEYKERFVRLYTVLRYSRFGEIINKVDFRKELKSELRAIGYRARLDINYPGRRK